MVDSGALARLRNRVAQFIVQKERNMNFHRHMCTLANMKQVDLHRQRYRNVLQVNAYEFYQRQLIFYLFKFKFIDLGEGVEIVRVPSSKQ